MGTWLEPKRTWHDTTVTNCPVCGRLIPRRCWSFGTGSGTLEVCSPDCERLYWDYYVPTYGELV
jgi:hypothetical protein